MNGDTPIRKPLVKKVEDFQAGVVVEEVAESSTPIVEKPVTKLSGPKQYRCKTRCWAKKQLWEVGEIATFEVDEFVPEHFTEMG